MVKSHRLDQRDVLCRSPRFKMFLVVSLLIVNLREPLAQINSMLQMRRTPPRNTRFRTGLPKASLRHEKERHKENHQHPKKSRGTRRSGRPSWCSDSNSLDHSLMVTVFTSV